MAVSWAEEVVEDGCVPLLGRGWGGEAMVLDGVLCPSSGVASVE